MRTVRHSLGHEDEDEHRRRGAAGTAEPNDIGCVPENGNSHADTATTTVGARPSAYAPGRRLLQEQRGRHHTEEQSRDRDCPPWPARRAAPRTAAFAQRLWRHRYGQQNTTATAPSANIMPSPNVTRPESALHR